VIVREIGMFTSINSHKVLCSMIKNTTQVSPLLINLVRVIQLPIDRCLKKRIPVLFTSSSFVS
jgi:hypothetical protein